MVFAFQCTSLLPSWLKFITKNFVLFDAIIANELLKFFLLIYLWLHWVFAAA